MLRQGGSELRTATHLRMIPLRLTASWGYCRAGPRGTERGANHVEQFVIIGGHFRENTGPRLAPSVAGVLGRDAGYEHEGHSRNRGAFVVATREYQCIVR